MAWVEGLGEVVNLLRALSIDLSFDVGITFAWPDLMPDFSKWQLAAALGSIGLQNVQRVFNLLYFNYMQGAGEASIKASVHRMLDGVHGHDSGLGDAMIFLPFNIHNSIEISPAQALLFVKSEMPRR